MDWVLLLFWDRVEYPLDDGFCLSERNCGCCSMPRNSNNEYSDTFPQATRNAGQTGGGK